MAFTALVCRLARALLVVTPLSWISIIDIVELCADGKSPSSDLDARRGSGAACCPFLPISLMQPLLRLQHSFVLADPTQPDVPITFASEPFLQLCGYPRCGSGRSIHGLRVFMHIYCVVWDCREAVLGRNCRFLQGPDTSREELQRLKLAMTEERPITVRLLNYRQDGRAFWNSLHVAPVRNCQGKVCA